RILQVGFGPLSAQVAAFADSVEAQLSLFEADRRLAERARLSLPRGVAVIDAAEELAANAYDLMLASGVLHLMDGTVLARLGE
ncbi:hypothetical protein, partial [Klebsiella pneumoniae]